MNEDKPKQQSKHSLRITGGRESLFEKLVLQSGKSKNKYVNDRIFDVNADKQAQKIWLMRILAENQQIKVDVQKQDLLSEDVARELKLIRTALMSLMGRRS